MIMPNNESTMSTNMESSNFNIEMNGTMFSMLSKNVYNDVILAPIREWSTNAIDACIAAGNEIKFDVHLPTGAEPTFSVRDYGTGLDEEDILNLFATFGASTKRDSNQFNGTFGIGRMSALAYTNQFTVESFRNGEHISYLVTTKDSIPQMVHLGKTITNEPNGLKLSLPVDPKNYEDFKYKAKGLYKYFSHKPNVNLDIDMEMKVGLQGTNWKIDADNTSWNEPTVLMGNVPYRIDTSKTEVAGNVILEMPLGSVSITPGRESLTYDDQTIQAIDKAYKVVVAELKNKIEDTLADLTDHSYEEYRKFNSSLNSLPYFIKSDVLANLNPPSKYYEARHYEIGLNTDIGQYGTLKMKSSYANRFETSWGPMPLHKNTAFLIADTRTKLVMAADEYLKERNAESETEYNKVMLVSMEKFTKADLDTFKAEAEQFLNDIGVEYGYSSDYVSDKKGKQANSGAFKPHSIYLSYGVVSLHQSSKLASEYDEVFYIPTSGSSIIEDDRLTPYMKYLDMYNDANPDNEIKVVGVNKTYIKDAESLDNFTLLYDGVEALAENNPLTFGDMSEHGTIVYKYLDRSIHYRQDKVNIPEDVKEYYNSLKEFYREHHVSNHRYSQDRDVHNHFEIELVKPEINTESEALKEKYGIFFKLMNANTMDIDSEDINHYLELIGEKNDTLCRQREYTNDIC